MRVSIYATDQAKSFESREFTQELTQPGSICFFSSNSAIFEDFIERLSLNAIE